MNTNTLKVSVVVFLGLITLSAGAQIDVQGRLKDKINQKANEKIDNIGNRKDKTREEQQEEETKTEEEAPVETQAAPASKTEEVKSFSKFDFVPGEQVIYFEDFAQDAVGDFPAQWDTDGSGEIVTLNTYPGHWLKMVTGSTYAPTIPSKFPDNYTVEYDLIVTSNDYDFGRVTFTMYSSKPDIGISDYVIGNGGGELSFVRHHINAHNWKDGSYANVSSQQDNETVANNFGKRVRVSVWVQKERMRLYVNEKKVYDLPKFMPAGLTYDAIRFYSDLIHDYGAQAYISNIRIAAGAPDTRNKLLTEGKLVTRGITFDSGSDKIKPESYGTLKDIATVLNENPAVKVKIIGHTDSDGADAANLELSQKRAAAVKSTLTKEFGVDGSRMQTEGKGEAEPASPNTTPEGKANNRRVEFIKM